MNFNQRCYELLKQVPKGKVTTYKILANALGTAAYRAVGNAMNRNPHDKSIVPCHRVVNSNGDIGGYAHNIQRKIDLLKEEGVDVKEGKIVDFRSKVHKF